MPNAQDLRRELADSADQLAEIAFTGNPEAAQSALIMRSILYVGAVIEDLRDDLKLVEANTEARHRDLLSALQPAGAPKEGRGTFTFTRGKGVSDPVAYDAPMEEVQAAFDQAGERSEMVEGETRIDPEDGNAYVKAGDYEFPDGRITITDIFGGHRRSILSSEWERWQLAEEQT